ncbi:FISUMP domain-containing protein [Fibrobacter succinogenes]|uniref:FISUMP domain-containing protein n=1 Tax=Fibrobacter succinogenes TaxID=833 RepID=UPI001568C22D|nr:FISUMP domain-containing protein [Fibrobacter succinogenes]
MSPLKYLILACSIVFFACSEKIAGTWEDESTFAQQSSSSVVESSAESSSSDIVTEPSEIEVYWIDSIETKVYYGCGSKGGVVTYSKNPLALDSESETHSSSNGVISPVIRYIVPEDTSEPHIITLDSIIEGRVAKLVASGISESDANSTAQWELFRAIGIDTILLESTQIKPIDINSAINYIFGGTTKSDFFKEVKEAFTETGTLEQKHYCNFDMSHIRTYSSLYEVKSIYNPNSLFASHILYNQDDYKPKGCSGGPLLVVPIDITSNIERKCLNLPYCNSSIKDSVIKTSFNGIGERAFICRESVWDAATDKEAETYGIPCDKEGKYIVHSKQPEYSYMCSLDSGWHAVYTIDAETYDIPCDKYGKLFKSPNRPNITYVCKDVNTIALSGKLGLYSCRTISIQDPYSPHASCRKVGWEIAKLIDFETADVECDSEGKTHQSPSDSTLYYVCHKNKWTEFYNAPCDTDNKRIKTKDRLGFFICYNKTWRYSYRWNSDYPAEYYLNPDIDYGHFTDPRDNREYSTIEYKGKTWMAENMKYEGASENERKEMTFCNGNCENVGRYYNHEIAGEICPDGWRLPDSSDIIALGDSSTIHKLYTQFSGIGNEEPDSTLNPYGMSFLPIGKIEVKITSNSGTTSYKSSLSDKPCVPLWLNKTDGNGNRLYATIGFNDIDFQWYTPQQSPPNEKNNLFIPIRCIKK